VHESETNADVVVVGNPSLSGYTTAGRSEIRGAVAIVVVSLWGSILE
jgi:hypothetical protein